MPTDHSGDQQAAPLRYGAIAPHKALDELYSNGSVSLVLCDLLAHLLATVERLEAAERNRTHMRGVQGNLPPLNDWDDCPRCGYVECVCGQPKAGRDNGSGTPALNADTTAPAPVPPSPPAAGERQRVERWAVLCSSGLLLHDDNDGVVFAVRAAAERHLAGSDRLIRLTELRDGEEIIATADLKTITDKALQFDLDRLGIEQRETDAVELVELRRGLAEAQRWTRIAVHAVQAEADKEIAAAKAKGQLIDDKLAATESQLARLRARLADGVRGKVVDHAAGLGGQRSYRIYTHVTAKSWSTGDFVLVLPDEPEGLTTDSTNPEPGRGTK